MLFDWALKPGFDTHEAGEETHDEDGSFTRRMGDIRRRLLDVLGMDKTAAEVGVCSQTVSILRRSHAQR